MTIKTDVKIVLTQLEKEVINNACNLLADISNQLPDKDTMIYADVFQARLSLNILRMYIKDDK